jgi:hypothetical protein
MEIDCLLDAISPELLENQELARLCRKILETTA